MSKTIKSIEFPQSKQLVEKEKIEDLNVDEFDKAVIIKTIQETFEQDLLEDGKGSSTIASYTGDVQGFIQWLEEKKLPFDGKLTRLSITSYRKYLEAENYKINTINKKINSLHSFNHFLIAKGYCQDLVVHPKRDKIKVAHGSEAEVTVFSEEEIERLLFSLENKEQVSIRDKTMIYILLYSGLRVSELVNLKIKDMDLLTMNLKVVGKGGKFREVPLKSEAAEVIKDYLETERKDSPFASSEYLLVTQKTVPGLTSKDGARPRKTVPGLT